MAGGQGKGQGGCKTCAKIFLVIANIIFGIVGAAIMTVGILLLADAQIWGSSVSAGGTLDFIPKLAPLAQLYDTQNITASELANMSLDLSLLSRDLGIALTVIGGFLLLMAIFGCSIFCCDDYISTVLYVICLCVVIIAQLAILIVFTTGAVTPLLKDRLKSTIDSNYGGADKYDDGLTVTWNFFMIEFKCCGLENYEDFNSSSTWNRNRAFLIPDANGTDVATNVTLATPLACCKFEGTFPDSATYYNGSAPDCAMDPLNSTYSNYDKGCWNEVSEFLISYRTIFIAVTVVAILVQIVLVIVTLVLFCASERQKDQDKVQPINEKQDDLPAVAPN